MQKISLTRGLEAVVSDEDYDFLNQWKWWPCQDNYAVRSEMQDGQVVYIRMHVVVAERAGLDASGLIDHRDRNGLNNQRHNLRSATQTSNGQNRGPNKNNTSGFKGVRFEAGKWRAQIKVGKKRIHLGRYVTPEAAAVAYNAAAEKYFGEFAYLNPL